MKRNISHYNPKLKNRARALRKNMTEAEVKLWQHLRRKQLCNMQFLRQRPIGEYIVDFYCPEAKLVNEVDGEHHYKEAGLKYDTRRDAYLRELGLTVMRFSNTDIMKNINGVAEAIREYLERNCSTSE